MRIPIYQMAFGLNQFGEEGLLFSEEFKDNNQSVLYTIPLEFDNLAFLFSATFYFPFFLKDEYYELESKIKKFPELTFDAPIKNFQITFDIDFEYYLSYSNSMIPRLGLKIMNYVGKFFKPSKEKRFLPLIPVDLYTMDELYLKYKGVFVGLTPSFEEFLVVSK